MKVEHDKFGNVTGVVYADRAGNHHRQRARILCLAGNSIETPRILLNSASSQYPDGLANSSGKVGKNYMRHTSGTVWGVFERPVRMYRGVVVAGCIQDQRYHRPDRGFVGGYYMQTDACSLSFSASSLAASIDVEGWGPDFTRAVESCENTAGMWFVGEDMPQESNGVTLHPTDKDQFGMPIPKSDSEAEFLNQAQREAIADSLLGGGLEPPRLAAYAPQTYVSAISPPEHQEEPESVPWP